MPVKKKCLQNVYNLIIVGDLKIRVASCEFLHAVTIYLTGSFFNRTEANQLKDPLTQIYSKLFPVILSLAVDLDDLIRQLFSQLLTQVFK